MMAAGFCTAASIEVKVAAAMVKYAELWCKTNFSFLEGASHADELVGRAKELGYEALAITDRNSLAGVVRAHQAARRRRLKLLIGAEITPSDGAAVILLAMNLAGYRNLALLITRGRRNAAKGECRLTLSDLADHADNLLAIIPAHPTTTPVALQTHRDIFRERAYLAAAVHLGPCDEDELAHWARQSRLCRLPMVASNQVHYHVPERRALHDVLTAVKNHTTVAELGALRFPNGERHLKSPAADGRSSSRLSRCRRAARSRWPTAAISRSTNCATNIPKNCAPPAKRRPFIWRN